MALRLTKIDAAVQCTLYVWNIYHVSMQSAGILSIYRRLNGGLLSESRFARVAILGVNATLAFFHIDRFPPIYQNLMRIHFPVWALRPAFLSVATIALLRYLNCLRHRPRRMRAPELTFLLSSLLLFRTYLLVRAADRATFGMLMAHFVHYLCIICRLYRITYFS